MSTVIICSVDYLFSSLFIYVYFDLSDYQFPFVSQINASISKQITRNHFGLSFKLTVIEPFSRSAPTKPKVQG